MKELQKHLDAFERYFQYKQSGHGVEESIMLLKSDCKVTRKTLYDWKDKFDWDAKESIRSLEINKKLQQKTNNSIVKNKIQYLGIYNRLLKKLEEQGYPIEIKSIYDLNMVVKGSLLVQDEPTENIKSNTTAKVDVYDRIKDYESKFINVKSPPESSDSSDGV